MKPAKPGTGGVPAHVSRRSFLQAGALATGDANEVRVHSCDPGADVAQPGEARRQRRKRRRRCGHGAMLRGVPKGPVTASCRLGNGV